MHQKDGGYKMAFLLKSKTLFIILLLSLVCVSVFYSYTFTEDTVSASTSSSPMISDLRAISEDQQIRVTWNSQFLPNDNTSLALYINSETSTTKVELKANESSYILSNGIHGQLYDFTVVFESDAEPISDPVSTSALFLEQNLLPDLPIIFIETVNAVEPSYEEAVKPEGAWGRSVVNNHYVAATIAVYDQGSRLSQSLGQIRVRGNTSALGFLTPYKLKLTHPADLIGDRSSLHANTDWLLLPGLNSMNLVAGLTVSELCGLEWQPACKPVNVILNGDWRGSYYLVESVERGAGRVDISSNGFIIEADAYWWNEDLFFRTPNQSPQMAFTFRYPSDKNVSEQLCRKLEELMTHYEDMIANGKYNECIDCDSFVSWLLTHDLLGSSDTAGSNIFFYQNDLSPASKLKIGPAWDFDSVFRQVDEWSNIHTTSYAYFDLLLQQPSFVEAYINKWNLLAPEIVECISERMDLFCEQYGEALQMSWALEAARYNYSEYVAIDDVVWEIYEWFDSRTSWMNDAVNELSANLE